MNTWKVIFATLVIFGAGVITGGLIFHSSNHSIQDPQALARLLGDSNVRTGTNGTNHSYLAPPPQIPGMRKDFVKRLDREIHLSNEQRERIEKIMAEGQEDIKELWDQIAPQCHEAWLATQDRIRAELTEEQKAQFVEFMKNPRKPAPSTNAMPTQVSPPAVPTTNVVGTNTLAAP